LDEQETEKEETKIVEKEEKELTKIEEKEEKDETEKEEIKIVEKEEKKEKEKEKTRMIPLIMPSFPHDEACLKNNIVVVSAAHEHFENFYYCGALVVNFGEINFE